MGRRVFLLGALVWALLVSVVPAALAESPPHVQINTPEAGSTVSGTVLVTGNAWDPDGEVVGVKVHIDDGEWSHATDTSGNGSWWTWEWSWDTTLWDDGWHGVGAVAWDNTNMTGDDRIDVFVDNHPDSGNTAPWVTIDEPESGSTVRGVVTVRGRAGDEDANDTVELVQVKIDLGEWRNATSGNGTNGTYEEWSYDWNTSEYEEGWHAFRARAFDGDLYSEPAVAEYFVDNVQGENTPPFAEISHPRNEDVVWGIILVHGVAGDHDDGDRVELVQVAIDPSPGGGECFDATDTSHDDSWSTWAWQWDTAQYENGVRHVCARAYDGELYSETNCRTVRIANENHRPTVKILHPGNGEKVRGTILIHGVAADDHGVRLVEVRFGEGEWREAADTSPDDSWTTWAYEWDTTHRDDGCVLVSARSWDGSLFSEIHKIELCVDNENDRPWAKIFHPEQGETVNGLVLVHGTAGDDQQVKLVQVRIDDREWQNAINTGHDRPWSTWAYEWDTTEYENGEHHVCARAYDGELYSEPHCVGVIVHNTDGGGGGGAPPAPFGNATPFVAFSGLAALGVAILMWLRSNGFLRK